MMGNMTRKLGGGVCVGEAGNCVGMEQGGSLYFDRSGGFSGMTVYTELYLQIAGEGRISTGYEAGLLGAEGRGAYAGASAFGVNAEVSHLEKGYDGVETNWGMQEDFYYQLKNEGKDPETGKSRKYVGWKLGPFDILYDHGNRNDNPIQKDVMEKKRKDFEQVADEKGLVTGHYSALASALHEKNLGLFILSLIKGIFTRESPKRTIDKMWMGRESIFSFLYGWFLIPSVEGLFYPGGEFAKSPSYNYGNVFASHFFLDVVPHWVFDD